MKTACAAVLSPRHVYEGHPESPSRFSYFSELTSPSLPGDWDWLQVQPAGEAEVLRVHSPDVLHTIRNAERNAPAIIDEAPTYVVPGSLEAALAAAGGVLAVTRAVLEGSTQAGLALVRPPGHHAESRRSMGFCLINNLAIAVRSVLDDSSRKVMIVDFDAHHGNGTQDIFENEPRVAFISTHQYGIYPGTGGITHQPQERGRIVNVPLPVYSGNQALMDAVEQAVIPLADQFGPEVIFVSAGFDAHWKDPLTALGVSTRGYYEISTALVQLAGRLCGGKIIFVLEGGYHPLYLKENVQAIMCALAGVPPTADSAGDCPYPAVGIQPILDKVRAFHHFD